MRELIFNVNKEDAYFIDYIHKKVSEPVRSVGGVCAVLEDENKKKLGIGIYDECFPIINKIAKTAVAEILAVGYKNRYLKEKIKIDSSDLIGKTLLDTMCIFDSNYDTNLIKRNIYDLDTISLEGCYNFRIKEIKRKWDDIVALSNSYSGFLSEKSVVYEFLAYLLDAIPCLCDTISVIINDKIDEFQLLNQADVVLSKFEIFSQNKTIQEELIFNLICYNPNLIKFCGNMSVLGDEFCEIINEFFQVREFLPKNN